MNHNKEQKLSNVIWVELHDSVIDSITNYLPQNMNYFSISITNLNCVLNYQLPIT